MGEANVVEKMRETGALIGGEGNGGVIDPRVGFVRDPFIGMGLILNLMAESGKKLSELVAELPGYSIIKDKYEVGKDRLPDLFARLRTRWPEAAVNRFQGRERRNRASQLLSARADGGYACLACHARRAAEPHGH